ncbi:hypothetical protein BJY01DRAFT_225465 [Aspergillus pseudoustus]|uniref:Uncharacterized protein n=1 Tax=Aspergillus pseudoustus TaxID=1810923 RepID=A0ABR4IZA2_9EURO
MLFAASPLRGDFSHKSPQQGLLPGPRSQTAYLRTIRSLRVRRDQCRASLKHMYYACMILLVGCIAVVASLSVINPNSI